MRTMQTLLNVVDFGMNVQQAIEAPRWSTRSFPASPFPHTMYPGDLWVEGRIPDAVVAELTKRGHKVTVRGNLVDERQRRHHDRRRNRHGQRRRRPEDDGAGAGVVATRGPTDHKKRWSVPPDTKNDGLWRLEV